MTEGGFTKEMWCIKALGDPEGHFRARQALEGAGEMLQNTKTGGSVLNIFQHILQFLCSLPSQILLTVAKTAVHTVRMRP